jgi:hypothetical protein
MNVPLKVLGQYGPSLDDQISRDAPYDLLPEPLNLLVSLVLGVALVVGRNWIADLFESVTGWGRTYRQLCMWCFAVAGTLQVIAVIVDAVRLLL